MSENATATQATVDWNTVVAGGEAAAPQEATTAAAAPRTLPELPLVIGRLPIRCDTKKAIIALPEATANVHCAAVFANTSVLSDCYKPAVDVCRPAVKFARPLNDREIEVVFVGDGDGVVKGLGWKTGGYPGAQLETRSIEFGVPFVEVLLVVSRQIGCGCDSENWKNDEWGA